MSTPESTPTHLPSATLCQSPESTLPYARVDFIPVKDFGFGLRNEPEKRKESFPKNTPISIHRKKDKP
jgi:hypothetical protein